MSQAIGVLIFRNQGNVAIKALPKRRNTIGRSLDSDIFLRQKGVSRCHATIYFLNGSYWILDGDMEGQVSTNGLLVNGFRISVQQLKSHDVITFCKGVYAFYVEFSGLKEDALLLEDTVRKMIDFSTTTNSLAVSNLEQKRDGEKSTFSRIFSSSTLDDLTKLPNRSAFFWRVKKSLEFRQKISVDHKFSVLFIDVDRFKVINDSLGHLVGDKFLIAIAEKLSSCIREHDMVARLGGDEFAILLDSLNDLDEAILIAKRIQDALVKPLKIDQHELYPSISIGIALSSLGYKAVEDIIRDADTAMYHAKNNGRSRFVVFDEKMHQKASEMLKLDSDLRRSIERQELKLNYQPIIAIESKRLIGFEALIRWEHPQIGLIDPGTFIPIAEETNFIYQIGDWILDEAFKQLKEWNENPAIKEPLSVNVNISSKQLSQPSLAENLLGLLKLYQINPAQIKLEVTESILMESGPQSIEILNQLKTIGVQLAIDDFGTGYSSLSYLHKFPIDMLKIDRSFISEIDRAEQNTCLNITNSIINLAHSLGVKVVAEGVERIYHLAWLQQQSCDYAQGYLFSKPLNVEDATVLAEHGLEWTWKI